jgi:hypothetical protein
MPWAVFPCGFDPSVVHGGARRQEFRDKIVLFFSILGTDNKPDSKEWKCACGMIEAHGDT